MQSTVQSKLMKQIPELNTKKQLIEYYVGYQFPERQRKMFSWWSKCIELAIKKSGEVYLSPAQLQIIFTVQELKPSSLNNILKQLEKNPDFEWQDKTVVPNKSLISSVWGYVWKSEDKGNNLSSDAQSKVISLNYTHQLISKVKEIITEQSEGKNLIKYNSIEELIRKNLNISYKAIDFLFQELKNEQWLQISTIHNSKFIFFSKFNNNVKDSSWVQLQKSKYLLREKAEQIDRKLTVMEGQQRKLHELAKKWLQEGITKKAKQYLLELNHKQKHSNTIRDRKQFLQQKYEQLQKQQLDGITIDLITEAHEVLEKIARDPSELSDLLEKQQKIKESQSYTNKILKENTKQEENDVEELLRQLQLQVIKQNKSTQKIKYKQNEKQKIPSNSQKQIIPSEKLKNQVDQYI